jgi:outer membrane protein OmpA-like peptidoglycan-associated protein
MKKTPWALTVATCLMAGGAGAQTAPAAGSVRSTTAIGYPIGQSTKVDLAGSESARQATGEAKVEAKQGITNIEVKVQGMPQPSALGTELLTYVVWVVSPEGRTSNVGELLVNKSGQGQLKATTELQTFSLIVTAEPYFAVRQPNEVLILENELRKGTKGKVYSIKEYHLMRRAQYQKMGNPLALSLDLKNVPLEMYEARNAVEIAKARGAEKYSPEIMSKADASLKMAENALARKADRREVISQARATVQSAEDARALTVQRQEEERIRMEREAAAAKAKAEAEARAAAAAAEAKRRADAEAARQAELAAAREAKMAAEAAEAKRRADAEAARQAELAAAREAQLQAEAAAKAAQAKAEADILRAKEEAAKAEAERSRQAAEQLRAQLLGQFNRILETRDTARGLVVNMADVLFDVGKFTLHPTAREKLARLSGIVLAHPSLKLEVEGHTDSTGGDALNQKLSEQRAGTVRSFLIEQGLPEANVSAQGFGKTMPIADNATAAGRQQNRRVEIIVSGEVIGTKIGQ